MSIFEVLLALALLAVTFLSLMGVLAMGLRADKKSYVKDCAYDVASYILEREFKLISNDSNARANFWGGDSPNRGNAYKSGVQDFGGDKFSYEICTTTVSSFNAAGSRLKKVQIFVHWGADEVRSGYGSLLVSEVRYLSEANGVEN